MKLPPIQALVFLVLTLPASAQSLWSGSGTGIIEEISLVRSTGLALADDPKLGSSVNYDYFLLGTYPSGTPTSSQSVYLENIFVSQLAGYGSGSPFRGSAGNYSFATGGSSWGRMGKLNIVNDLVFDTTPLLNSFQSVSGLTGVPSQLAGDSIIFSDDTDFSRTSSTYYHHTLLILNDPSGTAFDSAFFDAVAFDLSKFTTTKLYHEIVSSNYMGSTNLNFVADLKSIPEPGTLVLVVLGVLPLARRRRLG